MVDNYTVIESSNSNITRIEDLEVGHYRLNIDFRFGSYNEVFANRTPAFAGNADKIQAIVNTVTAIGGVNAGPYDPNIRGNTGLEKFEDATTGDIYRAAYLPVTVNTANLTQRRVYGIDSNRPGFTNQYIWTPRGSNEAPTRTEELMYGVISSVVAINPISISINDVSVTEGANPKAFFAVTLSDAPDLGETVSLNYATDDGSAINNSDYRAVSGSLTFKAGETTKIIEVGIINNYESEPDENFRVRLSQSSPNTNIIDAEGVGTISDALFSSTSAVLNSAVENLTLTGNAPINGTGSSRDNIITGNANNNTLRGERGNDTILGQGGDDTILGMAGNDTLTGGTGSDSFAYYASGRAFSITEIGKDRITDLTDLDKIVLSKTTFTALESRSGNGFSVGSEFAVVNTIAAVSNSAAKIVFSTANQTLYYNANGTGNGFGAGAAFVELVGVSNLSASNFLIGEVS